MSRAEGRLIAFRSGLACVVDEEDADAMIAAGPWFASRTSGHIYAQRDAQPVFMHVLLMGRKLVDHIDGCGLNNTRSNLRLATAGQNQANRRIAANNAAGFKGVVAHRGHWRAQINVNRTRTRLGLFDSREQAARAYDEAARAAWGEFACVNFPQGSESGALILPDYESYRVQ